MSEIRISEAGTVQFPMVKHAAEIGWTPIAPEAAKQKRGGEAGMMLRDELEAALSKFNTWMTSDAIRQVIEKLEAIPPTIEGNRDMLAWLRGERQWYDEGEKRHRHVQLIDFERPGENVFQVTWEWKLKPPARKGNRADVMFVINGVPVCIVEHKNPKDGGAIDRGVTQLKRYEKETPELIGTPQLFNVTHLLDYWYGVTWNAIRHTMAPSEMTVPAERLDKEFFELAAAEGVTDIDELNKVLDRAVGLRTFFTADDRIEKVAAFVAEHFREKVHPLGYKAFLVGVNREACAKYKRALDRLLPPEWSEAVYTDNAADVVDRPLVAEVQLSPEREADVRLLFKKPNEDPKILIVTDRLLTGYDAPLLYCMYLDKPMRDHVLLQAIARVNRPYVDANGVQKRVGLVVDFVGVLRELKKALQFDSSDVSGVIEDLDLLLQDFLGRIAKAKGDFLDVEDEGSADEKLEKLVYGRFLDPEPRKAFFEAYKEIEALWEILSPSPELRDHITTFKRLAQLYAAVRNAYADRVGYLADLAYKTRRLVEESATQDGLGKLTKTVTFDVKTLEGLRGEPGSDEGKVFNLVRGLQKEIEDEADTAPVLQSLKDRAERILKDLENRNTTGLAAMDMLAALAKEKEDAIKAAKDSGLSARAFGVYWNLKENEPLRNAGISAMELARDAETEMHRFPNARVNDDERRKLRATLYRPLLGLGKEDRGRVVDLVLAILLDSDHDAES
ncbi:MAG: type I restriction endonuclease [Paracoccus sp. (in: a-proteobacteria)]|uniref:type I restriction endonuclease n=1 Tax=Paracoccus sp. TaxID=267 RepID=UPI003002B290